MGADHAVTQSIVDKAYALHDAFISEEVRALQMAAARTEALASVSAYEAAAVHADSANLPAHRARLLYLRGKALACSDEGRQSEEAEHMLANAVKLDPSCMDAWNVLGECFWHRGELELARCTFRAALDHERNAMTLCHLSMLLRNMSMTAGGVDALLVESVALAKESVRLDTSSSRSWAGLGAAHLSLHVHVSSEAEDLHLAHRAFTQAAKVTERDDADLIMNHAQVAAMLDKPDLALRLFTRAHEVDPALNALAKRTEVWRSVVKISEVIGAKHHAPQKVVGLPAPSAGSAVTLLSQLGEGENAGKVVVVKIVVPVPQSGMRQVAAHQGLIIADTQGDLMALALYAVRGVPALEVRPTPCARIHRWPLCPGLSVLCVEARRSAQHMTTARR